MDQILGILSIIVGIVGILLSLDSAKRKREQMSESWGSFIVYIIGVFVVGGGIYAILKSPVIGILGGIFWPFVLIVWGLLQVFKFLG
jgi:hypothetical protein